MLSIFFIWYFKPVFLNFRLLVTQEKLLCKLNLKLWRKETWLAILEDLIWKNGYLQTWLHLQNLMDIQIQIVTARFSCDKKWPRSDLLVWEDVNAIGIWHFPLSDWLYCSVELVQKWIETFHLKIHLENFQNVQLSSRFATHCLLEENSGIFHIFTRPKSVKSPWHQ